MRTYIVTKTNAGAGAFVLSNGDTYIAIEANAENAGGGDIAVQTELAITVADIQAAVNARPELLRKLAIKAEAQMRILRILQSWKQMNLTAGAVHLQSMRVDDLFARQTWYETWNNAHAAWTRAMFTWIAGGSVPANSPGAAPVLPVAPTPSYEAAGGIASWGGMLTLFGRAKAIRTHSDALEANSALIPNWPE